MTTDAQRKRRLAIFGGIVLVAIVAVAVAIGLSSGGSDSPTTSASTPSSASDLKGTSDIKTLLAGIPQKGNTLGSPKAKATMMVFADLQCPFCAEFENSAFPTIVKKYVRTGKLKMIFEPIVIIGQDSILGARGSAAAARQNKMFDFNSVLYRNQGEENTGYLDKDYVKKIAAGVPGLDVAKLTAQLNAPPVNKMLGEARQIAAQGKVDSTPSFFVAKGNETLQKLAVTSLDASGFTKALDALTA